MRLGHQLGVAAIMLSTVVGARGDVNIPDEYKISGFAFGFQAWTFNRFSVFEAIEMTAKAGGRCIEFYPGQKLSKEHPEIKWDHHASDDLIAQVKAKLKEYNILAVNYGVVGLPNNEAECRSVFEFAKKMGLIGVTSEPDPRAMDSIEKLVKEYDIRLSIHDHPKRANDPNYKFWDPNYVLSLVKDRDARMGACADTGHWVRSGLKPVECLRILKGRVMSSHLKDLNMEGLGAHDVPYGTGVSDIKGILDELKSQGFNGNIDIEYEYQQQNPMPNVIKCVEFMKEYGEGK
jgi:sugar phosphate isomerase/epimerase